MPCGKQPPPPIGTIYALNYGASSGEARRNRVRRQIQWHVAPERTLQLDAKLYAVSIAVDSSGNLYVGYFDTTNGASFGKPDSGNEIAIYAPGASGGDQPTAVLKSTANTTIYPIFMALDPSGRLVTYGATNVDGNTGNAVMTYAEASKGGSKTDPEYAFAFSRRRCTIPALRGSRSTPPTTSISMVRLNPASEARMGCTSILRPDIGDPSAEPSRLIPWDPTTELSAGFTSDVALNQSAEVFIANFVKTGSGSSATCQAQPTCTRPAPTAVQPIKSRYAS